MKTNQKNKIQVNLYYLKSDFKNVLLRLCKKILMKNEKLLVNLNCENDMRLIDDYLWTYDKESFLPHTVLNESISDIERIVLFKGSYRDMTKLEQFKQIVIAPNVKIRNLKFFYEYKSLKWKILN